MVKKVTRRDCSDSCISGSKKSLFKIISAKAPAQSKRKPKAKYLDLLVNLAAIVWLNDVCNYKAWAFFHFVIDPGHIDSDDTIR